MAEAYHNAIMDRLGIIGSMDPTPMPRMSGGGQTSFGGPATGTSESGMKGLIDFGHFLQSRGFRVSENSRFGGVEPVHVRGSDHYKDRAIDVNFAPGTSAREQRAIDAILKYAAQYGMKYIWRAPGHYNHAHFYF
jgi:hypothetical protein